MQKRRTFLWVGALLLGLSLAAGYATADTSAGDKKPVKGQKGKAGDPCKISSDCDQSSQRMACRNSKCQVDMPPPPT